MPALAFDMSGRLEKGLWWNAVGLSWLILETKLFDMKMCYRLEDSVFENTIVDMLHVSANTLLCSPNYANLELRVQPLRKYKAQQNKRITFPIFNSRDMFAFLLSFIFENRNQPWDFWDQRMRSRYNQHYFNTAKNLISYLY